MSLAREVRGEAYTVRLVRDRLLLVGEVPDTVSEGWNEAVSAFTAMGGRPCLSREARACWLAARRAILLTAGARGQAFCRPSRWNWRTISFLSWSAMGERVCSRLVTMPSCRLTNGSRNSTTLSPSRS